MTVTRVALNQCLVKDCHFPEEEHYCWGRGLVPHDCSGDWTHQHIPKKGMGGRNSKSQIEGMLCSRLHDIVDNFATYKNEVVERNGLRFYRLWKPEDEHKPEGWALVWKEIPDEVQAQIHDDRPVRLGAVQVDAEPETTNGGALGMDVYDLRKASSALVQREGAAVQEPSPDFGPDFLELPEEFTLQDAVPWAAMVGKWEHGRQWYAGDLLLACEARFGHERLWGHSVSPDGKTFVDLLGMTYASLRNCQRVCQAFSPGERFPLSFGHHAACYKHPERDRLMEQATTEGWTVSRLREAVSGHMEPAKHDCPLCGQTHRVKPCVCCANPHTRPVPNAESSEWVCDCACHWKEPTT